MYRCYDSGGTDTLVLGSGILAEQIGVQVVDTDLILTINATDSITVSGWVGPGNRTEYLQ